MWRRDMPKWSGYFSDLHCERCGRALKKLNSLTSGTRFWYYTASPLPTSCSASRTLDVDVSDMQRRFYSSYNSILCKCKSSPEPVKLQLVKSYCLPYLTYCVRALEISKSNIHHLSVCWNDAFRKIFGFKRCELSKSYNFVVAKCHLILIWPSGTSLSVYLVLILHVCPQFVI